MLLLHYSYLTLVGNLYSSYWESILYFEDDVFILANLVLYLYSYHRVLGTHTGGWGVL